RAVHTPTELHHPGTKAARTTRTHEPTAPAARDHTSRHSNHAPTSTPAIATEGRFERSENLIAQRAPGRAGAMQRSRAMPAEGRAPGPAPQRGRATTARNDTSHHRNHAPTSTPAIASEGRFELART